MASAWDCLSVAMRRILPLTCTVNLTFTMHVKSDEIRNHVSGGTDLMKAFVPQSPFVAHLGVRVENLTDDEAVLRLPWRPDLATVGDMVHGGAVAALADMTVMAAAWCGRDLPDQLRGVTTSLSMEFLEPTYAEDLLGHGRALRRGNSLTACEAEIVTASGTLVAKALATYKVG